MMQLQENNIYLDSKTKEMVEFCYMGGTGLAIVCEPGDRGGGMQSTWAIDSERLIKCVATKEKCPCCNRSL